MSALHYITLHYITFPLHYISLHYITLHYITLHYITLYYITLHYITFHYITLHYITLHHITSHHITSHHITSHHIPLHYITLHYITLHCIALHCITLYYITLRHFIRQLHLQWPMVHQRSHSSSRMRAWKGEFSNFFLKVSVFESFWKYQWVPLKTHLSSDVDLGFGFSKSHLYKVYKALLVCRYWIISGRCTKE